MEFGVEQRPQVETEFDREVRARNDITTWLAEAMPGEMRTPFNYYFDGRELYSEDGEAISHFLVKGILEAQKIAEERPNLAFEKRRRVIELEEYQDMLKMMRGQLPDTMVVISDFPPELMDATEDVGGYDVERKQTMLRVITHLPDSQLVMFSQSLDGSNRSALEAIYASLGYQAQPGELLGQRMYVEGGGAMLVSQLTNVYDRVLEARTGIKHKAGREVPFGVRTIETYQFVCNQTDLVAHAVKKALEGSFDDNAMYQVVATANKRYDEACQGITHLLPRQFTADPFNPRIEQLLAQEIKQSTAHAIRQGKSYSGCGITIGPIEQLSAEEQLKASGLGNKTNTETRYKFDQKMYCRECQKPPKKGMPKKMCGPCGFCRDCDGKKGGQGWS